uniref:Uncharacterized protein n=1 Tax=Amphimedon queenslandica TaxID=400682 RepID=A0A1X7TZF7_AMPQE
MAQGGRTDYPDDFCWKIFDDFSNQIFIKVQASPGLLRKLVEAKLLHNPMEKEKLLRIFEKCPVIGCKALMTCMRAFLRKGRDPKVAFENSLSIFDRCEELKEISARMKAKARAHNAEKISQRPEDDRSAKEVQGTDDGIPDKIKYLNFFRELLNKTNKSEAQIAVALNKRDKIEVVRIERGHQEDDFHALGRCIALSSCTWRCRFTLRSLNVQHVRMFVSGLSDLPKSLKGNPCLEYIGFSLNEIGSEGFGALMNMPESVRRTISELFLKGIMADKNALVKGVLRKVAGLEKLERFDFQGNRFK